MSEPATTAAALIGRLGLVPHPEGGWYRELWRADAPAGERAAATSIHFLLEAHQASQWHKVDATEIWLWHSGDPLLLSLASCEAGGPIREVRLGPDVLAGEAPQQVIAPGKWQAASPLPGPAGFTLVSCIVSPGFDFAGFTLAPRGWAPGAEPGAVAAD